MAPRAYWSGHLRLSLVALPVRLYAATTTANRISLHQIHKPSGKRIRHQNTAGGEEPVERDEIVRGYEYEKGQHVLIEDEELEALKVESRHTVDLVRFVEAGEIDAVYYDRPYFLTPDGKVAEEAYVVIRDALRQTKRVALGQIVLSSRERICAVKPCGRGLLLETLRYADEVREADAFFDELGDPKADPDHLALAKELIERRSGPFDPEAFTDRYQEALKELVAAKLAHRPAESVGEEPGGGAQVIDLMEALRRSVEEDKGSGAPARKTRKSASSKSSTAKASSKKKSAPSSRRKSA